MQWLGAVLCLLGAWQCCLYCFLFVYVLKCCKLLLHDVFLWGAVCVCLLILLLCFVDLWYLFVALAICFLCGELLCLLVLVCRVVGCLALVAGVFCSSEVGCFVMCVRLVVVIWFSVLLLVFDCVGDWRG